MPFNSPDKRIVSPYGESQGSTVVEWRREISHLLAHTWSSCCTSSLDRVGSAPKELPHKYAQISSSDNDEEGHYNNRMQASPIQVNAFVVVSRSEKSASPHSQDVEDMEEQSPVDVKERPDK